MVRYADTPAVEVGVDIAAPPRSVWDLVTDINLPARFSTEFQGAEWLDGAGPALGSRFLGRNAHDAVGRWQTTCTIVSFEPERTFGWAVGEVDNRTATWRFDLTPAGDGTRLTMWAQMGPGPSGLTPAIEARPDKEELIVARRLEEWRANMEATVAGIRDLAESDF